LYLVSVVFVGFVGYHLVGTTKFNKISFYIEKKKSKGLYMSPYIKYSSR
jgi:hypothetical protein